MVDYFYLFSYKLFSFFARYTPTFFTNFILKVLCKIVYYLKPRYYYIVGKNLDIAFPKKYSQKEKKKMTLDVFYNLGQTIIGFMKRKGMKKKELLTNISFKNEAYLLDAIKNKEKIIFITGHYSNWELLAPALASKYNFTLAAIGRKLDSDMMDKVLLNNREQFGVEIIYRNGAIKGAIKALKQNKTIGVLLDQSLGEKQGGIKVDFFGKMVGHSPAASVLARIFKATMIPAFISTDDYIHYTVTFYKPIPYLKTANKEADILSMTQAQAHITQQVIKEKPQQWFWVHKRWKAYYPKIYTKSAS